MRSLGRLRIPLVVLAVVLSVSVVTSAGSLSFTADRQTGLNVTDDPTGILGLEQADSLEAGAQERLVTVENGFGADATVTISLTAGTDEQAYLVYDGTEADSVTITGLAPGDTADVDVCTPKRADSVSYTFSADAGGVSSESTTPRTVQTSGQVSQPCTSGGGGSGGNDTTPPSPSIGEVTKTEQNNGKYRVDVSWSATDNVGLKGGVDEVRLLDENGNQVARKKIKPRGTEDSGRVELQTKSKTDPSGYTVVLEITDSAGNSETVTDTVP